MKKPMVHLRTVPWLCFHRASGSILSGMQPGNQVLLKAAALLNLPACERNSIPSPSYQYKPLLVPAFKTTVHELSIPKPNFCSHTLACLCWRTYRYLLLNGTPLGQHPYPTPARTTCNIFISNWSILLRAFSVLCLRRFRKFKFLIISCGTIVFFPQSSSSSALPSLRRSLLNWKPIGDNCWSPCSNAHIKCQKPSVWP